MSLLSQFVSTLTAAECERLRQIPLRGKQATILSLVIDSPNDELAIELKAESLGMSASHLHATLSLLLQRCYDAIVTERGFDLLVFLQTRGLPMHFKREFQAQERFMRERIQQTEYLQQFYLRVLHLLMGVTSSHFDTKLFTAVMIMCRRSSTMSEEETSIHFCICETVRDLLELVENPSKEHPRTKGEEFLRRLSESQAALDRIPNHLAQYHLSFAFALYYSVLDPNHPKCRQYLQSLKDELQWLPEVIRTDEWPKFALREAIVTFLEGNIEKAYRSYLQEYRRDGIALFQLYGFHLDRFIRAALAHGDTTLARELLDTGFISTLSNNRTPMATAESVYRAQLELLVKDYSSARVAIERGFRLNTGSNYSLVADIQLRLLEWLLSAAEKAAEGFLDKLATRNIKHFNRKGHQASDHDPVLVFNSLKQYVQSKQKPSHSELEMSFRAQPVVIQLVETILG